MKTVNRVLYFSLNPKSVVSFYECLNNTRLDRQCCFKAIDKGVVLNGNELKFKHVSDLLYFLKNFGKNGDLGYLYVIIDYPSFFNIEKHCSFVELEKTNGLESFSVKEASKIIRRAILQYPEVFFMFDESWYNNKEKQWFPSFLFDFNAEKYNRDVLSEYHKYAVVSGENPFDAIIRGRSNLFDGSNLRYAIKRYEYDLLIVGRYNFSLVQDTRANNLAICVEEEHSQNRFNSYALYANGFRVLPVVTASELKYINSGKDKEIKPDLIIRDFDLQFPDAEGARIDFVLNNRIFKINDVDYLRGVKFWDSNYFDKDSCPNGYLDKWQIIIANQSNEIYHYWENLQNIQTFFISKGVKNIELCRTKSELSGKILVNKPNPIFQNHSDFQYLRGLRKPVSGIYCPLRYCEKIKERYKSFDIRNKSRFVMREASLIVDDSKNNTNIANGGENKEIVKKQTMKYLIYKYQINKKHWLYWRLWFYLKIKGFGDCSDTEFDKFFWKDYLKNQAWVIDTSRENHDHGVPLDVYDLVLNMLSRAKHFYSIGKYIRSAVISSETIELLNGFHESLMLRAYYYLAISENAIAINITGGSEIELIEDTNFRINKIKKEIDRILERPKNENQSYYERRELKSNILNQIYSECRKYCREKEYFGPENCFISAIAHLNEGFSPLDIRHELGSIWNRIKLMAGN